MFSSREQDFFFFLWLPLRSSLIYPNWLGEVASQPLADLKVIEDGSLPPVSLLTHYVKEGGKITTASPYNLKDIRKGGRQEWLDFAKAH